MIDFERLILEKSKSIQSFCYHRHLKKSTLDKVAKDYKEFLNLPIKEARILSASLGFHYSFLLFQVELNILQEIFAYLKEKWNDEITEAFYPSKFITRYFTDLDHYCFRYKKHLDNKDMARALAVTAHIHAIYKKENLTGVGKVTTLTHLMKSDPELEAEIKEHARTADYFLQYMDQLVRKCESHIQTDNLLDMSFLLLQTIL